MKGAWGMAKDQLTGDSADDSFDPKLSPLVVVVKRTATACKWTSSRSSTRVAAYKSIVAATH